MPPEIAKAIEKQFAGSGMQVKYAPGFDASMKRMFSSNPIYAIPRWIRDAKFEIRMAWQRVFRGWDDSMVWNFHHDHSHRTVDMLKKLKKSLSGHPGDLDQKTWEEILGKMIAGFEAEISIDHMDYMEGTNDKEEWKRKQMELEWRATEGWDLFRKYYRHLWD